MKPRVQADAAPDGQMIRGLRGAAPDIDLVSAIETGLTGLADPEVLRLCAEAGRILVSRDRGTMPGHFIKLIAGRDRPAVILWRGRISIALAIEEPTMICEATANEKSKNRIISLPL